MYTVSLHGVKTFTTLGLYPEESVLENEFETDVDVWTEVSDYRSGFFVDYTVLNTLVRNAFHPERSTLELLCEHIQKDIRDHFPFVARVRVCVRKLHPPMEGKVGYSQVCLEL
ncbi:MAG: dihydroneopterin aldolase [Chitinophagaceae bacterium]